MTGLLELLEHAAELLEYEVARGDSKLEWDLKLTAKALRKAHKYFKPNPLGGPAKMFDAMADHIRAGEEMADVIDDYGMRLK